MKHVVIVGAGFAGLNAAKGLGNQADIKVTIIDRKNHHLFQPLLYQVATAGLSPAEIAAPIRSLLSKYQNIEVRQGIVEHVDLENQKIITTFGELAFDYLILACGAKHTYFGHEEWEAYAPGLKILEQATEIRRRILTAFEDAENATDKNLQKQLLTFVIIGGGPTGVELAGAIGEMSRHTLAKDFRNIDPKLTRVILLEGGDCILPSFSKKLSNQAMRELQKLGVQVWTSSLVTHVDATGVKIGNEQVEASTVLWAAGVKAASISQTLGVELDQQDRVMVEVDLSLKNHPHVFVAGDQANFTYQTDTPLPGIAPVAMQQGRYLAKTVTRDIQNKPNPPFKYWDKGQMATIGRSKAIVEIGKLQISGFIAWMMWVVVHIFYLTGFKNRFFVVFQWTLSYLSFRKGARLIIQKEWQFFKQPSSKEESSQ